MCDQIRIHAPTSLKNLPQWAIDHGTTIDDATTRFLHFVILDAIGSSSSLSSAVILGGADALRLFYGGQRPTKDMDLFAIDFFSQDTLEAAYSWTFRPAFDAAVQAGLSRHVTEKGATLPLENHVTIDLCPHSPWIDYHSLELFPGGCHVLVWTPETVIATKLEAILGQTKNTLRKHDVLDIALLLHRPEIKIDTMKCRKLLRARLAHNRSLTGVKSALDHVRSLSELGFQQAYADCGDPLLSFNEAWDTLLAFVCS